MEITVQETKHDISQKWLIGAMDYEDYRLDVYQFGFGRETSTGFIQTRQLGNYYRARKTQSTDEPLGTKTLKNRCIIPKLKNQRIN